MENELRNAIDELFKEMEKGGLAELNTMRKCTTVIGKYLSDKQRLIYLAAAKKVLMAMFEVLSDLNEKQNGE